MDTAFWANLQLSIFSPFILEERALEKGGEGFLGVWGSVSQVLGSYLSFRANFFQGRNKQDPDQPQKALSLPGRKGNDQNHLESNCS